MSDIDGLAATFFGSHKVSRNHRYYLHARDLAATLGCAGWTILSGGGPGIMHAANSGASSVRAPSIGLKSSLLDGEQILDPIFSAEHCFHFLFVRRFVLAIRSNALIFYPGGFGTLNELFEYAVLLQTRNALNKWLFRISRTLG